MERGGMFGGLVERVSALRMASGADFHHNLSASKSINTKKVLKSLHSLRKIYPQINLLDFTSSHSNICIPNMPAPEVI
jgi:hypothetical protein